MFVLLHSYKGTCTPNNKCCLEQIWSCSTWSLFSTEAGSNGHITAFLALFILDQSLFRGKKLLERCWRTAQAVDNISLHKQAFNHLTPDTPVMWISWVICQSVCALVAPCKCAYVFACVPAWLLPLASRQTTGSRVACLASNRCCDVMEKLELTLAQFWLKHVTFVITPTSKYCGVLSGKLEGILSIY